MESSRDKTESNPASLADALAAHRAGDLDRAASLCRALLDKQPAMVDAMQILGVVLARQGLFDEADAIFGRAIGIAPRDPGLLFNHGNLLKQSGRSEAAAARFRAAIAAAPDHVEALYNLGHTHQEFGRLETAATLFRRAVAVRPLYAKGWSALATVLKSQGNADEAMECARRAIAINPRQCVARLTLANLCRDSGRAEEAIAQLRAVLDLEPDNGGALALLVHQLQQVCDWAMLPALGERLDAANASALNAGTAPPEPAFANLARVDDPAANLAVARGWASGAAVTTTAPLLPASRRARGEFPVRIAYFSNDLQDHPVGQLVAGLLAQHDRTRFHVSAYSWGRDDGSETRRRICAEVDSFIDIAALDHRAAAQRIRNDGIELLIDLKGHTQGKRLDILAARPAPVQATFLAFPGSSGADFIDYIIADRIVLPPEHRKHYSEQPAWLPHCYLPVEKRTNSPASTGTRADWGLPGNGLVLASFNNGYKIEPVLFEAWMTILRRVPGAVLWLHRYNDLIAGNLQREAAARHIDPERLVFATRPEHAVHLARLRHADLALDTRIFNGHTTTVDALSAGVPLVALLGRHFASRVAASALTAAGLASLVTESVSDYVETAVLLLQDRDRRLALRRHLDENRHRLPLFDLAGYARAFDAVLVAMVERHRAGEPPAPIDLPFER
jgi:predicted O-linked N-acetylglucosamine transferase (SPINDLY family)